MTGTASTAYKIAVESLGNFARVRQFRYREGFVKPQHGADLQVVWSWREL